MATLLSDDTKRERAARMIATALRAREALDRARDALPRLGCRDCGRLLFFYSLPLTHLVIKCPRCGTWNETTAS